MNCQLDPDKMQKQGSMERGKVIKETEKKENKKVRISKRKR